MYPKLETLVSFPLFKQSGKPYEFVPQPQPQKPKKKSLIRRIITALSGDEDEEPYIGMDEEGDTDPIIEDEDLIEEDLF